MLAGFRLIYKFPDVSCRPQLAISCPGESRGLLDAFAQHITRLLTGQRYTVIDDPERRGAIRSASTVMGGDMTCAWLQPTDFGHSLNAQFLNLRYQIEMWNDTVKQRVHQNQSFWNRLCRILRSTFLEIMATNFPNKQWKWKHNKASTARVYFVSPPYPSPCHHLPGMAQQPRIHKP